MQTTNIRKPYFTTRRITDTQTTNKQRQHFWHIWTNSLAQILNQIKEQMMSLKEVLPQSPMIHRIARQLGFQFGIVGTAFTTANAVRISLIENQNVATQRELHTLTHIVNLKIMANKKLTLEEVRYSPARLASAANTLGFQTMEVARIVSAMVQQWTDYPQIC